MFRLRVEIARLLAGLSGCPTCRGIGRCQDRVVARDGGCSCRAAVETGMVQVDDEHRFESTTSRGPGWSLGAVIPCPQCANRPYSTPVAGRPWRRCDGPRGRGHTWNPRPVGESG